MREMVVFFVGSFVFFENVLEQTVTYHFKKQLGSRVAGHRMFSENKVFQHQPFRAG